MIDVHQSSPGMPDGGRFPERRSVHARGIRRFVAYYILFFIDITSRSVHVAGITPRPDNRG
jgi:hypothetical protein